MSSSNDVIIVSLDLYWIAFYCCETGELIRVALPDSPEAHDFVFDRPKLLDTNGDKYITDKGVFIVDRNGPDQFSWRVIARY